MQVFKTTLLLTILTLAFLLVGDWLGGQTGMIIALVFAAALNFGSYF
jgi:heat shock protein HtpX